MKFNNWTLGLAAVGVVSLASAVRAEEKASSVLTALSSTTLSGFVDTSAQWNFGTGNAHNPGYSYNSPSKADGFNLNVVELSLEKVADASDSWGAGYRVDTLFGPDASSYKTVSTGTANSTSDFAIKQAYVDLKVPIGNSLDVKMGVFDNPNRYEKFESGRNANFTRSYGFGTEASALTGLLATYQVAELVSIAGGVADTYGPTVNQRAQLTTQSGVTPAESYKTYLGNIGLTAPKDWGFVSGSTLDLGILNGFNKNAGGSAFAANETSFYAGLTLNTPIKELQLGASYDYASVNAQPLTGQQEGYQNATGIYAQYQVTEKFSLNARGEYFSQSTGAAGANAFGTIPDKVIDGTLTARYDLWKNVISRVELRWDRNVGSLSSQQAGVDGPIVVNQGFGGNATEKNAFELIGNIVYKF